MLSDHERETLCEIERRLRDEDPRLAQALENAEQPHVRDRRGLGWSAVIIAAGLLGALMLTLGQPAAALVFALTAGWAWGRQRQIWPGNRP
ncbi:hypothetical protein UK23_15560 [Lentzea aerocolonigenes]|uniref:DUF3040 domain-containing protein n=1 Tax=Lentzea aerocolonigenes TaxID=68170 RepID=A0A0F0H3T3_LENAE|nr:DUF3040 domain-containing protein [Lentzea aerocolonigenes]KJK48932.1 hypothetical protein UK23_15560 [Lentzea aerocolonigenes]